MQAYRAWDSPSGSCPPRFQEEYERPHVIEMSLSDWGKVSRELHLDEESDEKYPRLSYNSATSKLTIQCIPLPTHDSICGVVTVTLATYMLSLPPSLSEAMELVVGEDQVGGGRWRDSGKRPDLGISVTNSKGALVLRWVLEAGFSESYDHLLDDARLWLEGRPDEISMVVLVNFVETRRIAAQCHPTKIRKNLGFLWMRPRLMQQMSFSKESTVLLPTRVYSGWDVRLMSPWNSGSEGGGWEGDAPR
ncbi:hypothetical protein QBC33DRAFT_347787 [Phialemonium atrogriseum]|uniref:Uncharacterized protein n=1 Tax=Phialemonium atrogriseum TaxID=1093897 RepID=A0AAJ0C589_9PEZI|nr:uncharacterized protein QBC33DRAFT_347787 [Phialemonium atrogriseum]KAK1769233.1 hypothetical protein QBC33DRAFT_347787 [Phialemonium atrogriseum]